MRSRLYVGLVAVLAVFFGFIAHAAAAGAVAPEDGNLLDLAKPIFQAIMQSQWWMGASLALVFAVTAFKRYAPWAWAKDFANSDPGGVILTFLLSYGGALSTALAAGGAMSASLAWVAFKVAIGAMGGYVALKKLLMPIVRRIGERVPGWAKPIFSVLLWAFDSAPSIPKAIVIAEKQGDDAVKANPPAGAPSSDVTEI